ncbi:hypothetical protein KP509_02G106000 [Ceratopteris richardii]|nr:hypothetical protein KP509_02G106000 [Ceratopteris richardii]
MDDYHCELPADLEENSYPARRIYTQARLRATFYPKFENEKSDLEIRKRMIEVVQAEKGVLEVTLKHSGSLFMYSGDHVGAFAKNSFGNLYTAVGVFTLATTFQEAWRDQAAQKQREFNKYLERNHLCVSMELVTSVLGDHGQRPRQDYVVVTAVTDLTGKPEFFATPDLIAFCRQWRLPTNQVWLFSSRKSATSFFTSYDALCEEGTTTTVSRTLDEISDISVQASKSHTEAQGEILEGLVARIVSPKSTERLQKVIEDFPLVVCKGSRKLTPQSGLREICTQHMNNETEKIKALLYNAGPDMCSNWSDWSSEATSISFVPKFIKATALDHITLKLQEIFRVIWSQRMRIRTPCHLREYDSEERKALYRVTLHVLDDYAFRKYQKEMWY